MRIKLRDIADKVNVSTATVSRVLNDNPNVDERTRTAVLQAIRDLGYPLPEAKRYGTSKDSQRIIVATLGSIQRDAEGGSTKQQAYNTNSYTELVVNGIEAITLRFGIQMHIQRVIVDDPTSQSLAQLLQSDGVIIIGGIVDLRIIDALEQAHVPIVLAAAHLHKREINCVHGDYLNGASQAVQALASSGRRRIVFVNGPPTTTTSHDKLAGYRLGLSEAGLYYDEQLVVAATEFHPRAGYEATEALLSNTRDFNAILYASDNQAIGGLRALKEARIKVPEQVSIVGFYDEPFAQFTDPPLSSIYLDWHRVGEIAALRLVTLLKGIDEERMRIILPMKFTARASTTGISIRF